MNQVQQMVGFAIEDVQQAVELQLPSINSSEVRECFKVPDPFLNLRSEYMQTKYYKENFGLIEPVSIQLGSTVHTTRSGRVNVDSESFQYIPLDKGLKALFKNQHICDEVFQSHTRSDNYLADFCDGSLFNNHSFFQAHPDALQLIMYFDEIEVCNPLGSHAGVHKLGMFYYTLGNLRPELRSTQRSIQLIACVTSQLLVKYGFEAVLKPFIDDVNVLATHGIEIEVDGHIRNVKGTVMVLLADTLAAHQLGGFKVGVGFSLRKCRHCMATAEDIQSKFLEEQLHQRTPDEYNYHCSLLHGPLANADSTTYGINYSSALNRIEGFHVVGGQIPQDIMHVLFEGVLHLEVKLMLKHFIVNERYFTLDRFNSRMESFAYSRKEAANKPPKSFSPVHITGKGKLPLSAAQMWTFVVLLPLLIGDLIPLEQPHWECFLLMLEIVKQCTAKVVSASSSSFIKSLVFLHHSSFKTCYPGVALTPKMHFMVHFPRQLLEVGPFVVSWCMRMEAKNAYFKKVARISNFKNVAYSVSKRHQRLMCAHLQGNFFSFEELQCGPCNETTTLEEESLKDEITEILPQTSLEAHVSKPNWIKLYGQEYHLSEFVHTGFQLDDLPSFGQIKNILIVGTPLLYVKMYTTLGINNHLACFAIQCAYTYSLIPISKLASMESYGAHHSIGDDNIYIVMRSHVVNKI